MKKKRSIDGRLTDLQAVQSAVSVRRQDCRLTYLIRVCRKNVGGLIKIATTGFPVDRQRKSSDRLDLAPLQRLETASIRS